eukprot:TRINITY_DN6550_c0_g1_i5.p1 TRINITY_DN6550_c0_g1~~TRINITY_DN6550_c0_g1_i5.p1  ORF type:complete len:694 (+),score=137.48 TRINITY_DN6550_c0_g1_i5:49-2082(+)
MLAAAATSPATLQRKILGAWASLAKSASTRRAQVTHVLLAMIGSSSRLMLSTAFTSWMSLCARSKCQEALRKVQQQQAETIRRAASFFALAVSNPGAQKAAAFKAWLEGVQATKSRDLSAHQVLLALAGPASQMMLTTLFAAWARACLLSRCERSADEVHQAQQERTDLLQRSAGILAFASENPLACQAASFNAWSVVVQSVRERRALSSHFSLSLAGASEQLVLCTVVGAWARASLMARCTQTVSLAQGRQAEFLQRAAGMLATAATSPAVVQRDILGAWASLAKSASTRRAQVTHVLLAMIGSSSRLMLSTAFTSWMSLCARSKCQEALRKVQQQQAETIRRAASFFALAVSNPGAQKAAAFKAWLEGVQATKSRDLSAHQVLLALAGPASQMMLTTLFAAWARACLLSRCKRSAEEVHQAQQEQSETLQKAAGIMALAFQAPQCHLRDAVQAWLEFALSKRRMRLRSLQVASAIVGPSQKLIKRTSFDTWMRAHLKSRCEEAIATVQRQQEAALQRAAGLLAAAIGSPQVQLAAAFSAWGAKAKAARAMQQRTRQATLALAGASTRLLLSGVLAAWTKSCMTSRCEDAMEEAQRRRAEVLRRAAGMLASLGSLEAQQEKVFRGWTCVTRAVSRKKENLQRFTRAVLGPSCQLTAAVHFHAWRALCLLPLHGAAP